MPLVKKSIVTALVFVTAAILLRVVLTELLVRYEMWSTGAVVRAELSEDYGMGMMGLLVVDPGAILGALVAAAMSWVTLSRHNPPLHATRGKAPRAREG